MEKFGRGRSDYGRRLFDFLLFQLRDRRHPPGGEKYVNVECSRSREPIWSLNQFISSPSGSNTLSLFFFSPLENN